MSAAGSGRAAEVGRGSLARRAALVSLAAGVLVLAAKLAAWWLSGSTALLADALESTVNVVAAGFVAYSVAFAARPPDANHPYGHGKAEFVSAALEGGLILVAATLIAVEALQQWLAGPQLRSLGVAAGIGALAALANAGLGAYLLRVGRACGSAALIADGKHVQSDVWTTAGALVGLGLVQLTGQVWIDPVVALAVAVQIVVAGHRVVRDALGGLLDEADFPFLARVAERLRSSSRPEQIDIHQLRAWRSGAFRHIDLHVVAPRYFSIEQGHALGEALERGLLDLVDGQGDVVVHVDPCRPEHCSRCRMRECPVREAAFAGPPRIDVPALTRSGSSGG